LLKDLPFYFFGLPWDASSLDAGVFCGKPSYKIDERCSPFLPKPSCVGVNGVISFKIAYLRGHFFRGPFRYQKDTHPGETVKIKSTRVSPEAILVGRILGFFLIRHETSIEKIFLAECWEGWLPTGAMSYVVNLETYNNPDYRTFPLDHILSSVVLTPSIGVYENHPSVFEVLVLHEPPMLVQQK
jgi:hypothetical protein